MFIGSEVFRTTNHGAGHPLGIPRVALTMDLCWALGWLDAGNFVDSPRADKAALADFHAPDYIDAVDAAEALGRVPPETAQRHHIGVNGNPVFDGMFRRPATACGGGLWAAARLAGSGGVFYNPGGGQHHGRPDRAAGFCYFNEPALTIRALLAGGVARVFYLDLDAHQGDGVQDAFIDDDRVFTLSIHEAGRWPMVRDAEPGARGTVADGGPAHRNLPLAAGATVSDLDYMVEAVVLPLLDAFAPGAVYIQAGCDSLADDPQSKLRFSNGALWWTVARVAAVTPNLLVSGGGGYNPYAVGRCWSGIWATLNGYEVPDRLPGSAEAVLRTVDWRHRLGRDPVAHWLTTLADRPNPGRILDDTKDTARKALHA
ncbi:MAG: acetoin utilization protein AcuC [Rhodospirillaceae bacterium]